MTRSRLLAATVAFAAIFTMVSSAAALLPVTTLKLKIKGSGAGDAIVTFYTVDNKTGAIVDEVLVSAVVKTKLKKNVVRYTAVLLTDPTAGNENLRWTARVDARNATGAVRVWHFKQLLGSKVTNQAHVHGLNIVGNIELFMMDE